MHLSITASYSPSSSLTGDEFSTVGLSLGYIGGPYGLQNNFFENDVGLNVKKNTIS